MLPHAPTLPSECKRMDSFQTQPTVRGALRKALRSKANNGVCNELEKQLMRSQILIREANVHLSICVEPGITLSTSIDHVCQANSEDGWANGGEHRNFQTGGRA